MGGCSVVGCKNRFARGKLHFYRFPKDARRDVWVQFTRKGNGFQPKGKIVIKQLLITKL
jgi:THAP domain